MNKINLFITFITLITVNENILINAFRVFDVNGLETILALANEKVTIECKADMPMRYCGFAHPTGKRYSISDHKLNSGDCSIQIEATLNNTGEWRCHIGGEVTGVEVMKKIEVRVVDHVAAIKQNVSGIHGKPVTLACATVETLTPVRYCRFEPPNDPPFSIDSSVTRADPILKRYYFPENKSLDRGDCAVIIRKVKYEDVGLWTCGAGLYDGSEHIDVIRLDVEGLYTLSTASATGITFGAIGVAAFLVVLGIFVWKKRRFMGTMRPAAEQAEVHELERLPQRTPQRTPQESPRTTRHVPQVIIQSPSEQSSSPVAD